MLVNSSASSTDTHTRPSINSIVSGLHCLNINPNSSVFMAFTFTNILLLFPLCILVVYHGFQRWRQQRTSSTAASHSDSFTYHLVTMELVNVFGGILCCCGIYSNTFSLLEVWYFPFCVVWYGETLFHVATCVEHYLAVVHPITYLSLRKEKGIRIRKVYIGSIWLLGLGGAVINIRQMSTVVIDACILSFSVLTIFFCSLSVLWALIHPGPREQSRDQRRLTQTKQRAFYTILSILGVLLVRFTSNLAWSIISMLRGGAIDCLLMIVGIWCNLPCSLVLPLLYLHKAGKLMCSNEDIQD